MTFEEEKAIMTGDNPPALDACIEAWESACERVRAAENRANANALDGIRLGKQMMRDRIVAYFNDKTERSGDYLYAGVARIIEGIDVT